MRCFARYSTICSIYKKCEKHVWSVTFSKVAGFTKVTHPIHGCFSHFLNCTNGTKSRKTSHIIKNINDKYL